MYIEKALEKPTNVQPQFLTAPSPEEVTAQKVRWSRAWEIGQTIFSHAKDDEAFWSEFTVETSKNLLAIGAAGGLFAAVQNRKITDTVTRSRWVDHGKIEAQVAMTSQHAASYGFFGKLFGNESWSSSWLDLHIRTPGTDEAARYAIVVSDSGSFGLPALADMHLSWTEQAEAQTEALQVLEAIAESLGTKTE